MSELDEKKIKEGLEKEANSIKETERISIPKEKLQEAIRTYSSDISEIMRKEKGSVIKIALAEQKRRDEYKKQKNPASTKNILVLLLGMALIGGGMLILGWALLKNLGTDTVIPASKVPAIIFTENQVHIDVSDLHRRQILEIVTDQVARLQTADGTITNIYMTENRSGTYQLVETYGFLNKVNLFPPEDLVNVLAKEFMLGTYRFNNSNKGFLIFKVNNFDRAFPAIRDWERTMLEDLAMVLGIQTRSLPNTIFEKSFITETIYNTPTRVLQTTEGMDVLMYSFIDPGTILITTNRSSIGEILKRNSSQSIR